MTCSVFGLTWQMSRYSCRFPQAALLVAAIVWLLVSTACGSSTEPPETEDGDPVDFSLGTAGAYVEGVGQKQEIMRTKNHVDLNDTNADDNVAYNPVPPTSGDHWSTPVRCGFYIEPVPDELIVHNMEHSNIVVSYNLPEQADVDALKDVYDDLPGHWRDHFTVVRPYAEIGLGKVGLTAWGVLDVFEGVDGERIERFFEHYVGRLGPEGAISCRGTQGSVSGT